MNKMKLTKAQLDLLTQAVACGKATCAQSYPPVRKLVLASLATSHTGKFGGHWIEPTEAGRAAVRG